MLVDTHHKVQCWMLIELITADTGFNPHCRIPGWTVYFQAIGVLRGPPGSSGVLRGVDVLAIDETSEINVVDTAMEVSLHVFCSL
jgi:hypothetical protein